tara:strand:+ start:1024 stop:1209 length:186 start_codon:yes stop_codon:yes gene_type:complete
MNYNKAELCKDCKKPVSKKRDPELYKMFRQLETLVNRTSMESQADKGRIQRLVLKIMEWIF